MEAPNRAQALTRSHFWNVYGWLSLVVAVGAIVFSPGLLMGEYKVMEKPPNSPFWKIWEHPQLQPQQQPLPPIIDPIFAQFEWESVTVLLDKVLTSNMRLLAIANALLCLTYVMHQHISQWFLGHSNDASAKIGGYLLFKLLLISAVVAPDTLDLLILLSWYTMLSFLRSLAQLCEQSHRDRIQAGLVPPNHPGIWQLLVLVLCCDFAAAAVCVALFHGAGLGMVLLLTCDCVLLALDVIHQLFSYMQSSTMYLRVSVLEGVMYGIQILSQLLTIAHFLHIWAYHGLQLSLIDGVLALHVHHAMSTLFAQMSQRRRYHNIQTRLQTLENASMVDLTKANNSGDVCCICLGDFHNDVKKLPCGHLYHLQCLQKVVERKSSLEKTCCPLCRAPVMNERPVPPLIPAAVSAAAGDNNEQALFRFSTEQWLPSWMPIPAFSFEIVRRPPEQGAGPAPHVPSTLRRILLIMGFVGMTPEEEEDALSQLVDMFPQQDRNLLRRDLRRFGSSEAVAELALRRVALAAET